MPDKAEVIPNELGTAPVMAFAFEGGKRLYSMPGVPHEALGALPHILEDIRRHFPAAGHILHHSLMVHGIAESALSEKIAAWEASLAEDHIPLAYLPNMLTGIAVAALLSFGLLFTDFPIVKLIGGNRYETAQTFLWNQQRSGFGPKTSTYIIMVFLIIFTIATASYMLQNKVEKQDSDKKAK